MLCDERNSEGLHTATWVPGWEYPIRRSFERAITLNKPTSSPLTTLMDEVFEQVSRALRDGATGPEAFALLLRLLSGHFDRVDSGAGYKKLHTFGVPNGTTFFLFLSRTSCRCIGSDRHLARFGLRGKDLFWRWFG